MSNNPQKENREKEIPQRIAGEVWEDAWIPTVCWGCVEGPCLIRVHRVNGVAINVEGNTEGPDFEQLTKNKGRLCPKPYGYIQRLYNPYRIEGPLKRTNPEKGSGVDPKWVEISWDEALNTVAEKLKSIRAKDSRRLCTDSFQGTHSQLTSGTWSAFTTAFGPTQHLGGGASIRCDMAEHNWANLFHGAFQCEPDMTHCNYLLLFGSNFSASGGAPENVLFADAVDRGSKIVLIDPVFTVTAARANEWIPIRPGTDLALLLALIHVIAHELAIYDTEFLKNMTNSPYLIGPDGYFVREKATNRVMVWDTAVGKAKTYDDDSVENFALEGAYLVEGVESKPAFQMLKEHVRQYSPEWASGITDIPASTIRRIAKEFVDNALIGSTIKINGVVLPYRPVATKLGRGITGAMHSYQCILANHILACLVGCLEVPGGHQGGRAGLGAVVTPGRMWDRGLISGPDGMPEVDKYPFTWPPASYGGIETLIPYAKTYGYLCHLGWRNLLDPPENFPLPPPPEAYIRTHTNPLLTIGEPEVVAEALSSIPFVVAMAYAEDEVTQFADIVLPDHTDFERLHMGNWVRSALAKKYNGIQLRQPVVEPVHNTLNVSDILTELADRIGFLDEYNVAVNDSLNLADAYRLEPGRKYAWVEIVDRHCKSLTDGAHDLGWFEENGAIMRSATVEQQYDVHLKMQAEKLRYCLPYVEHVKRTGEELAGRLAQLGIDWWSTAEYVPLPIYLSSVIEEVSPEYDFYVTCVRSGQFGRGFNVDIPWLIEAGGHVRGHDSILMNEATALDKGIKDNDEIWVESPVGKVMGKVKLCQGIRPDTVAITGQFGQWATPVAKDTGRVSMTPLIPIRHSWTDPMVSVMQGQVIKAKVYKV